MIGSLFNVGIYRAEVRNNHWLHHRLLSFLTLWDSTSTETQMSKKMYICESLLYPIPEAILPLRTGIMSIALVIVRRFSSYDTTPLIPVCQAKQEV